LSKSAFHFAFICPSFCTVRSSPSQVSDMKHKKWMVYLALIVLLVATGIGADRQRACAQQINQVGLVVRHGNGQLITRCVEFSESDISGYEVLTRSGLEVVANFDWGMGAAICAIDGEGCPAGDCFCQCQGSPCIYWAYHHLADGQWVYSNLGASNYSVHHGDVEGWAWGEGDPDSGVQPPVIPFDQICVPPATDTPVPTATSVPPTDTPVPPTTTSVPPTATATPIPATATAAPVPPPEAWFRLDQNPIAAGACTAVRWDTSHAQAVYLDGESVALDDFQQVCPTAPQTYHLRVVGAETEATYELILGVTGATSSAPVPTASAPTIAEPSPVADTVGAVPSPSPFPSPSPSPTSLLTSTPAPLTTRTTQVTSASLTPVSTQAAPSLTPAHVAQAGPTPAVTDLPVASEGEPATSPLVSLGYVAFTLVVGSLLIWLILEMPRRG
jgi:hypothetical protein